MIKPDDFYSADELPDGRSMNRMRQAVEAGVPHIRSGRWIVRDNRSFAFGMAASIVLMLALVGAWTLTKQAFENAQPEPLRVERAYVSAIQEFERVVPSIEVYGGVKPQAAEQLRQRQEQLRLVHGAVAELRQETNGRDLSPLKRERLRQLYSQQLKILQQMIEAGDIEL
jgi:hypothetical protein